MRTTGHGGDQGAFSLIEIMIVASIIAIVAIVSIPNYMKSRNESQKQTCINNLRAIDRATQQWAFDHNKLSTDTYSLDDPELLQYFKGSKLPVCPGDGVYSPAANLSGEPTCSLANLGHTL